MQHSNYHILIEKLDAFIRKYYVNNLIRGSLHSLALVSVMWTTFVLLEHYVFSSSVSSIAFRKALFYSFSLTALIALGFWIFKPMVQYFRLGKIISHEKAAQIIGAHFSNVKDKLLNVLQLKSMSVQDNSALLVAAINQKTVELQPIPFKNAIDLKKNRKYLRFVLPPLFLFLGLLLSSNIIQSSTNRILNSNKEFEREAPFEFVVLNPDKKVVQFEDFTLEVQIKDKGALPSDVFIEVDNYKYKLEKIGPSKYKYTFYKIQKDAKFRLSANGFNSKSYDIDVLEKPNILDLAVKLKYPAYTGRSNENVSNVGDLAVPIGTDIEWIFGAENTDALSVLFPGEEKAQNAQRADRKMYTVRKKVMQDGVYKIFISNSLLPNADSVSYTLTVIPDLFPSIDLEKFTDSTDNRVVFLAGEASDDYGIRNLSLHYTIEREGKLIKQEAMPMAISPGKQTTYNYTLNMRSFDLKAGDKFSYYFQVWDNDAVQGSKSSKTAMMFYQMPTMDEVEKKEESNNEEIKSDLENAMKEVEELQKALKKAKEGVLQKNELNWQDRREIEKLLEQQKKAEEKIKEAQENFKENMKNQEEFQKVDEELMEKQKMLEELFEQVMSDEMKELFEQMEKMLENLDKNEVLKQMENMELNDEKLKAELDRMLELFKKMEVEKEMSDAINKLDSLAKKQEELSKETEKNENASPEKQQELQKKQEELNKEFDKVKEGIDKAKEKNEELEQPMDLDSKELEQQEKDVQEEQQNSSQQLNQKQNKNASKSQKNAAQKMKKMSQQMQQMMQMNQMQQMEQDVKAMRQLLENLVNLSFEQERLIDEVSKSIPNTPAYVALVREQFKLKDDFKLVEDSLNALAKRVHQIQGFITEKVADTKKSLKSSIETLEERDKRMASVNQQYAMTYVNDLALMLSESMEQMQQQMAQQMSGQQMCEKPGSGEGEGSKPGKPGNKPGMGGLKQMQDQLNQQIEKMQQQMKDGKNPSSKDFAEMAAKQAAIRKALQDMKRQKQQNGKDGGKELQELMNQMDKTETDLVNKKLPNDINKRQQDILTRMLEHEKAEREREYNNERKSEQPKQTEPKIPPAMQDYLKKRKGQVEMFKTVSPALKPYYKNLVEEYFRSLK